MSKILIGFLLVGGLMLAWSSAQARSTTALYRVAKIQHVYKLNDPTCVESKSDKCQKSLHWRVYYQALGQSVLPKQHQILLDDNPPQLGSVVQLTIEQAKKKG